MRRCDCDKCIHQRVCGLILEYQRIITEVKEIKINDTSFSIYATCVNHKEEQAILR